MKQFLQDLAVIGRVVCQGLAWALVIVGTYVLVWLAF